MKSIVWLTLFWLPLACFAQAEDRLTELHGRLALTPQQQTVWAAYENYVAAYNSVYYRQKPVVPSPEDAAPHQISRLVDNLQNRLAALEDVEAGAKALYVGLNPDQQKIANQMLILTIPTFTSPGSGFSDTPAKAHTKEKSDSGKRTHRGGAGGTMIGPALVN
jgi:hypothetical protein